MSWWGRLAAKIRAWWDRANPPSPDPAPPVPGPPPLPTPDPAPTPRPDPVPPVVDPAPPAPPPKPLDLSCWKLTLPIAGTGSGPAEVKQPALATFEHTRWFRKLPGGGRVFAAPVNGVTTSGSKNPRSELREQTADGKNGASWSSTDGVEHGMRIVQAFTRLPDGKPHLVGEQIHDANDDVSVFRLEGPKLWITEGDSKVALVTDSYMLGTRITTEFRVLDGVVRAFVDGRQVHQFAAKFTGAYFKAGAYVQANPSNVPAALVSSDNYGEVEIYDLQVWHGKPASTAPDTPAPPTQDKPRRVIQVIRHGEKDDDRDGADDVAHHLSVQGARRAEGIADLFTHPPVGLREPTRLYASQGNTSSRRMSETLEPLAERLGLEIDKRFDFEVDYKKAAAAILADPAEVITVCSEHSAIVALCKGFGETSPPIPKSWPDDRYDVVWVFETDAGDNTWLFHQVPERILPTDKTTVIK